MSAATLLHAALLRVFGFLFVCAGILGILLPSLTRGEQVVTGRSQPLELLIVLAILGAYLLVPYWLPRGLRRPSSRADAIWIAVLAAASWPSAAIVAEAGGAPLPFSLDWPASLALFTLLTVAFAAATAAAISARQRVAEALEPEEDGDDQDEAAFERSEIETLLPDSPGRRADLAIHHALLAVVGIAILMVGAGIFRLLQLDPDLFARTGQAVSILPVKIVSGLTVIAGLTLFVRQIIPGAVTSPSRVRHLFFLVGWLLLLAAPSGICFILWPALTSGLPVEQAMRANLILLTAVPGAPLATTIGLCATFALLFTGAVAVITAPRARSVDRPATTPVPATRPARRAAPLPRSLRPTPAPIRLIVRMIAMIDWVILRLIGFALLGGAYIIGIAVEAGRPVLPAALTWQQDPLHALGFYVTGGLLLAVPVLLPRSILVPTSLFKGLIKAALVAGGAVAAMPTLAPLAEFLPPDMLPPEVTALIPQAPLGLQAMAVFSIVCALIAGLIGQFGRKRKYDYLGNPIVELTPEELRQLRAARMGVNA